MDGLGVYLVSQRIAQIVLSGDGHCTRLCLCLIPFLEMLRRFVHKVKQYHHHS